jgi:plasmid rolling circle replication initiator protein Rep
MYDIGDVTKNQPLVDIHPKTGNLVPWQKHKKSTVALAESFRRIEKKDSGFQGRAAKLENCGNWLEFRRYPDTGEKTLNRANFCRYRLCPMCGWRRSQKMFWQTSQVMDVAENQGYRFLFVTLTIRNCEGSALGKDISRLFRAWSNLLRQKRYKSSIFGWMRILEITHNVDRKSKSFDTYHPHIHAIWAVKPSYFKKRYIPQASLIQDWKKAAHLSYDPNVDIRAVPKNSKKGAIKEVSKYATKSGDYLTDDDELTDSGVRVLDRALVGRRLVSWGGCLKEIKAQLNLDDVETGDLIHVDGEQIRDDLAYVIESYHWHSGYRQFMKKEGVS